MRNIVLKFDMPRDELQGARSGKQLPQLYEGQPLNLSPPVRPISGKDSRFQRGFDSSISLILRVEIIMYIGESPEMLSQQIVVGIILAGRLGVGKRQMGMDNWGRLNVCKDEVQVSRNGSDERGEKSERHKDK